MTQLDWAERERLVNEMLKNGNSPNEIAHQLKMSLRDIYKIINEYSGSKEKPLTTEHMAILLFDKGKKPPEVAIELRISLDEAMRLYVKYKQSLHLARFGKDYASMKGYLKELSEICYAMRNGGLKPKELVDEYHLARDLGEMENRQLEIMRGNEALKSEKYALEADMAVLQGEKAGLEKQIKKLKPEVEELERRYTVTYDHLTYPLLNNQTQNYNQPYAWYYNRSY